MTDITPEDVELYTQNMNKIIKLFKNIPDDPVTRLNLQRMNAEEQLKKQRDYEIQQKHFREIGRIDLVDYSEEECRIIQETPEAMKVTEFQLLQLTGELLRASKTKRDDKNYYKEKNQKAINMPSRNIHPVNSVNPVGIPIEQGRLSPGTELKIKGIYQFSESKAQHSIPITLNESRNEIQTTEISIKPYVNKSDNSSQLPRHSYGANSHEYFPSYQSRLPYHRYDFKPSYRGKRRRGH